MDSTNTILDILKIHINEEKAKLDKGLVNSIKIKGVYPSIIEEIFGDFYDCPEFNGWQGDYWAKNDKYTFFGCMYYGTVDISKREGDE